MKNNIRIDNKINRNWHYFLLCSTSLAAGIVAVVIMYIVIGIYINFEGTAMDPITIRIILYLAMIAFLSLVCWLFDKYLKDKYKIK